MPKKKAKKKAAKKKAAKKKTVAKKTLKKAVKKKAVKKKVAKKKVAKKAAKKKAKKKAAPKPRTAAKAPAKATTLVAPGPQPTGIPSVEEPASQENAVGTVTHYYSHLTVAIVQINKGRLRVGDRVHIKGHTTDLTQTVDSMEYEHQHVDAASAGQSVGIKVKDHVREHDIVYLMK